MNGLVSIIRETINRFTKKPALVVQETKPELTIGEATRLVGVDYPFSYIPDDFRRRYPGKDFDRITYCSMMDTLNMILDCAERA